MQNYQNLLKINPDFIFIVPSCITVNVNVKYISTQSEGQENFWAQFNKDDRREFQVYGCYSLHSMCDLTNRVENGNQMFY